MLVLVLQQPFLAPEVTTVTHQVAVAADHAVAGNDDADAVVPVGRTYGANGFDCTQPFAESKLTDSAA